MQRTERIQTSLTPAEKQAWKVLAAKQGYETPAAYLRDLVYDELEAEGIETSREDGDEGNPQPAIAE
jgi:hypothetical protein